MADVSTIELDHCRELAMQPGNVFEFTSRFLPAGKQQPLLALYALRQSVSSIPHSPVDDEVKWAKLKWWSEELVADPALPPGTPCCGLYGFRGQEQIWMMHFYCSLSVMR